MSYIDNNLLVSEHVLYRAKTHKIIFFTACIWLALTLILVSLHKLLALIGIITFIVAIYDFLKSLIRYTTSEFALTNKRVLVKIGFIRRQSVETFLQKIEGIQVDQGILGRIFNYGTIIVCGTGGTRDRYSLIEKPLEFRRRVQEQVEIALNHQEHQE
ncbi:MAG: PH domain-containing protein [Legionellales bacterium]|nr:PH domain-containing protein [Legionellales bacterium]